MPQSIAVLAVEVGTVAQRVHLVNGHVVQLATGRGCLDRIEQHGGLAVGQRHDQIAVRSDVVENRIGGGRR